MCEDVLEIAGLKEYTVVNPKEIKDADVAILLSETQSEIPKISIKLNTYTQLYESILKISDEFNTKADVNKMKEIKNYISQNYAKKDNRKDTKVKVYSNFLKDTIEDMGFIIDEENYDYIIAPDYMKDNIECSKNLIMIPSHKNVSKRIIDRINERYLLLENKLCMKQ